MVKLTDEQLSAVIRDVQRWAPEADPDVVADAVRRAWSIMDADPYGIAPIAFVGALRQAGMAGEDVDGVLRVTEHLVASMADWDVVEDAGEPGRYDA
jgi:hypothetical protein